MKQKGRVNYACLHKTMKGNLEGLGKYNPPKVIMAGMGWLRQKVKF